MKILVFLIILFILTSCTTDKDTFWCGDHPCINKKEKEAYFKKTMIVEIKNLKNKDYKRDSEVKKIIQQAKLDEKKRIKTEKSLIKQTISEEKIRIKEEKKLAKQIKLEEKRRIKEEKKLAKQIKLEEKRRIKEEKKLSKSKIFDNQEKTLKKSVELTGSTENIKIGKNKFSTLTKNIIRKNALKPYPNISDIPN